MPPVKRYEKIMIPTPLKRVDITEFKPIVEHDVYNSIGEKSQLSFVDKVFFGGSHKRKEHEVFVYHFACELCPHLTKMDYITETDAKHVRGASPVHDLGHPPFSHAIENLLISLYARKGIQKDHHTRTEHLIREYFSEIYRQLGLDPEEIIRIATKRSELSKLISHNTLGIDKLSYLLLDSHHTGYRLNLPLLIDLFPDYFYSSSSLGIQEERTPEIQVVQNAIQDMYMQVYLHPEVLHYARYVQKALQNSIESGELELDEIWDMTEGALMHVLEQSGNSGVSKQIEKYNAGRKQIPDATLRISGTPDRSIIIPPALMDPIYNGMKSPLGITEIERDFAKEFKMPDSIDFTISAHPNRIIPEDLDLYDNHDARLGTLFEICPVHYQHLLKRAEDFFTVRIYSDGSDFPPKEKVRDFVLSYFGDK
jgi:hypothetical protein